MIPDDVGDGYCDDHLNHFNCFFDDGDCCHGDLSFCIDCECPNHPKPPLSNELLLTCLSCFKSIITQQQVVHIFVFQIHSVPSPSFKVMAGVTMTITLHPVTMMKATVVETLPNHIIVLCVHAIMKE